MNTMDIERALAQGQQIPTDAPQVTPEIVQQGIAASQQQPPQIPTGEQAMNAAALEGMAKENAQYQTAVNAAQQQAQQDMAALANLFTDYSRPSDDIYNETYDNLVMNGIYGENAHRLASRKASEYSANRLARLQMGMRADGVTPDGYITNNGMYYLTQMQNEDPAVASLYSQGFGNMPKVAYDRQWDIAKSDHNAATRFKYAQEAANAQQERQMQIETWRRQQQQAELMQRAQIAGQGAYIDAYNNALQTPGMTPEQADAIGKTAQQTAFLNVLSGYNGGRSGGNRRSNNSSGMSNGEKEEKLSASDQKSINEFRNLYQKAASSLDGDDVQAFMDAVEKNGMKFDDDTYSVLNAMQYALNARRELTAWNDNGQNYVPENALEYANAVIASGHGGLLKGLEDVLQAAYKKQQ